MRFPSIVLALLCASAAAPAQQSDLRTLNQAWRTAYDNGDWDRAIRIGEELARREPAAGRHHYNVACCYGRKGDGATAVNWLNRAADAGFDDEQQLLRDPDLSGVRGREDFKPVANRVASLAAAAEEKLRERVRRDGRCLMANPRGGDPAKPTPLLIVLHGYGGDAASMFARWREVASDKGLILVVPEAIERVEGAGYQWGNVRTAGVIIDHALETVRKQYTIDDKRVFLAGFSQGGYIAYGLTVRRPGSFRGVISIAGAFRSEDFFGVTFDVTSAPRFSLLIGDRDPLLKTNREAAAFFKKQGLTHDLRVLEGVGHELPPDGNGELSRALQFVAGE